MSVRHSADYWIILARRRARAVIDRLTAMLESAGHAPGELLQCRYEFETAAGHLTDALVEALFELEKPAGIAPAGSPNPSASAATTAAASIARPDGDLCPGQSTPLDRGA